MRHILLPLVLTSTSFSAPLAHASDPETFLLNDTRPKHAPKPALESPSIRLSFPLPAELPGYALPPIDEAAARAEDALQGESAGAKSLRYGIGRDLVLRAEQGVWHDLGAGRWLWTADIVAAGALGLRVGLTGLELPEGGELFVYAPSDPSRVAGPYRGHGPFEDGHVWTPTSPGERARVEYYVVDASRLAPPPSLPFRIARVQHVYREPWNKSGASGGGVAGACHNDVNCYPELSVLKNACAGVGTVSGPNSIYCSGQLLNDLAGDQTPYFLTANHCLSTYVEAQDTEILWEYESNSCGGTVPSINSVPKSAICSLVATNPFSDFTLLMIEGIVPYGVAWSGWLSSPTANGTAGVGIHHPSGEFKRASFGNYSTGGTCGGGHFRVNWTDGVTEPGSSGSGFFRSDTLQLVGQLHLGSSFCGAASPHDCYGRFVDTYADIQTYMQGGSDDNYEPNDTCGGHPDISLGLHDGLVVKSTDEDWYEISVGAGEQLDVVLYFSHARGDIDADLWVDCADGSPTVTSRSNDDGERLTWINTSNSPNTVAWHVYLDSDVRAYYSMLVSKTPINDSCGNAQEIETDVTYFGTNVRATNSVTGTCGGTANAPDVWYRYSASQTGLMQINTFGSALDTVISVYDGCGGAALACNDNANDGAPWANGSSSYVSLPVIGTHDYLIRVAGWANEEGWFRIRADTDSGAPFCVGDGIAGTTCPCLNNNPTGMERGCLHSDGSGGKLYAIGNASLSNDTFKLVGTGMAPVSTCLYFQGTSKLNNGRGLQFGDGLRCAGGSIIRLGVGHNTYFGDSTFPESNGDPDISVTGNIPGVGGWRYYQVWYRDVPTFCTASPFNLTNGYEVFWRP
jgi:hypothetical protein